MIRKCTYTGRESKSRDEVLARTNEEIAHNWANSVPCDKEYGLSRKGRLPTELEMEANRVFKLLELARLDVSYYEQVLANIQVELNDKFEKELAKKEAKKIEKVTTTRQDKKVEQAIITEQISDAINTHAQDVIKERKRKLFS